MKFLRVALLAVVAMGAIGTSSALAALPEFSSEFPNTFKATSTKPKFEASGGLLVIECTQSEGTGTLEGAKTVKFDELFLGCEAKIFGIGAGKCTGLNDTTVGSILAKGTSTLGYRLATLTPLVALTISPAVHIECGSNLIVVEGCLLGTTTLTKSKTATLEFTGAGGKQTDTDYTTDTGVMKACSLTSKLNAEAAKESNQIQKAVLTFTKEVAVLD